MMLPMALQLHGLTTLGAGQVAAGNGKTFLMSTFIHVHNKLQPNI